MAASLPVRALMRRNCGYFVRSWCCLDKNVNFHTCAVLCDTEEVEPSLIANTTKTVTKAEKISRAMKAYLERGKAYEEMIGKELEQYEIGKRHLARIMGEDVDSFTQDDVDKSIKYLLPSGLYHIGARPKLKHPSEVFPKQKAVQFDRSGRPFHPFFYTGKPNYYQILHDANKKFEHLNELQDGLKQKGINITPDPDMLVELKQTKWMDTESLERVVIEPVDEHELKRFQVLLDRLSQHPLGHREKEFIFQYRIPLMSRSLDVAVPEIQIDDNGRKFSAVICKRKAAESSVKLWIDGDGKFLVNGIPHFKYFPRSLDREQILFPIQFVERLGRVDVEATVSEGGPSGQAGAIREAVSKCLTSFSDEETIQRLRIAGLLTHDPRSRERKKPGQPKARKKHTWKKR